MIAYKEKYYYGMRLRPAGPGCQPKRGLIQIEENSGKYHDIVSYNRKLDDEEVEQYELDFLGSDDGT